MPISDVVFLEGNNPDEVMNSENPYEYGKWFKAKNVDMIPLSLLGEILGVSSYNELMQGFQPVVPPEGEAFLLSFPEVLQDRIKSLTDDEVRNVVSEWSKIEEFSGDASEEPLQEYLIGLRDFLNIREEYAYIFLSE